MLVSTFYWCRAGLSHQKVRKSDCISSLMGPCNWFRGYLMQLRVGEC